MDGDAEFRFSPRPNRAREINWHPWGDAAFDEARRSGRPILLSLSAVWCHWCHVMDETTYSDPDVIGIINQHFIPVRVDNDRHPDVNRRYNMGGWPTTAFLAAGGDIVTGATYMPPAQMLQALERVREFFEQNSTALLALGTTEHAHAADSEAALAHMGGVPLRHDLAAGSTGSDRESDDGVDSCFAGDPEVPGDIPSEIALQVTHAFDPVHGGLGADPKFPQADVFAFMLNYGSLRGGSHDAHIATGSSALLRPARLREIVHTTLDRMAEGDLYDHAAEGFYRYSTQRDWSVPHYEKMLEDNARLALLYAEATILTTALDRTIQLGSAKLYLRTARGTVDYLLHSLWRGEASAFGGSQDADETYAALSGDERRGLPEPYVDPTIYVDWNALAARALLRVAPLLGYPELAERAVDTLDHLWATARLGEAMGHYLSEGAGDAAAQAPLLTDQAGFAAAALDAYEVTADRRWLEAAQALAGWVGGNLRATDGRLNDRLAAPGASAGLLGLPLPVLDENALFADVLLRLEAFTGDAEYRRQALDILAAWAPHYEQLGVMAAPYGTALLRYLERPAHIVVVGGRDDPEARRLQNAALIAPLPLRTVQLLDPVVPADAARIADAGYPAADAAAAYVCRGTTCTRFAE